MEETSDETEGGSKSTANAEANDDETGAASLDCPICLQGCVHPARLPCGHIFCFLCIKGVAYQRGNQRCAMCRREIPLEFLESPLLVNSSELLSTSTEDGYQWFYEGRSGWWQYDVRTSQDIEDAFKKGEKSCTILVAGYVYIVDLETMVQQRQNEPTRCRRVKRDLANVPKKGIAGLRLETNSSNVNSESRGNVASNSQNSNQNLSEDTNAAGFPRVRQSRDLLPEDSTNLASAINDDQRNTTDTDFDTLSSVIDLTNDSFEHQGLGSGVFPNTVQSNVRESENQTNDDFHETLNSLHQLTVRANNIAQDSPSSEHQNNAN